MKTYGECCHDVAVKYGLGKTLVIGHKPTYFIEAAEMYAQQFRDQVTRLENKVEWYASEVYKLQHPNS